MRAFVKVYPMPLLRAVVVLAALSLLPAAAVAQDPKHGLSAFGELKYPPDFKHFEFVNPDAPKGGLFSQVAPSWQFNQNPQTFNTLNTLILKGDAPQGIESVFACMMGPSGIFSADLRMFSLI